MMMMGICWRVSGPRLRRSRMPARRPPAESAVDAAEESMSSVGLPARAETDDAGESDAAEDLEGEEELDPDLACSNAQYAPSAVEPD
jgi:hypothetical protein